MCFSGSLRVFSISVDFGDCDAGFELEVIGELFPDGGQALAVCSSMLLVEL